MKSTKRGIPRILNAFKYSYDGFISAFKSEEALRQDILIFVIFTIIALFLPICFFKQAILISSLLFIVFAELTNTAIEVVIDRISEEYHELSKKAKDIGSCLVLLSFINAILIWSSVLYVVFFK